MINKSPLNEGTYIIRHRGLYYPKIMATVKETENIRCQVRSKERTSHQVSSTCYVIT